MKFLHLSDLHIGKLLYEYSLLEDQRHWCGQVLDFLRHNKHDAVVVAGDLYDRSVPPAEAVELLDSFFSALAGELELPVLTVSGNHDSGRRLAFGSSLYRGSGLYMAAVPQAEMSCVTLADSHGEVDFWLLPYITPADARNLLPHSEARSWNDAYRDLLAHNRPRIRTGVRSVLVTHGFFSRFSQGIAAEAVTSDSEVSIGGMDIVDASLFASFDYCAFGHLHAPQRVGGDRMRYSGSPLCYSVSEEKQHKALLSVELDADAGITCARTTLPPLRRVCSVTGSLDELCAATGGTRVSEDYVFVNILTGGAELAAAERVRALYPNYLGIRYRNPDAQELLLGGGEAQRKRGIPDAFGDFFLGVTGRALSPAEQSAVQEAARSCTEDLP